ncbi:FMN-dependent 2-nitropropane dioxygenase [Xylariaceae sp. FL0594]|nr:FMN-dependent 2-nitropropane dioxygenase [Xylariaceae sp. FL0594]
MAAKRMQEWFPGTETPLVVSAPMAGVTNARLACEVVKAGGLGFIQGGRVFKPGSPDIVKLEAQLAQAREVLQNHNRQGAQSGILPVGVGFVLYSESAGTHFGQTAVPILARHRPAAVWLFAPDPERPDTLAVVVNALKKSDAAAWKPKIVVQVGTVAAAREAAALGADVIVAQGVDAGGHGFVNAGSFVSLVPEVSDMLREEFGGKEIAVWAAGGIVDGRGVASALALGAEAAVIGTRYMVATESDAESYKRKALISATDGGFNTVKSQMHDHLQGNYTWPSAYDARAIVHPLYRDGQKGMNIKENEARYKAAQEKGDVSMLITWS